MKRKKSEKNLSGRVKGYNDLLAILAKDGKSSRGYRMPGSRSGRK